jgi:CxxC-x17-CxxC domain-containing protein
MKLKTAKKSKTKKTQKGFSKPARAAKSELPELVSVMMKIAERLEALEQKMDRVLTRVSVQPSAPQHSHPRAQQNDGQKRRALYQAVCADCQNHCEVPFKPSGSRPIYCKACFANRKRDRDSHKTNSERHQEQSLLQQVAGAGRAGSMAVAEFKDISSRKHSRKRKKRKLQKKAKR